MSSIKFNIGGLHVGGESVFFNSNHIGWIKDMRICPDDRLRSRSFIYFEPNGPVDIKRLGQELSLFNVALMCSLPGKEILGTYQVPNVDGKTFIWKVTVKNSSGLAEEFLWD